MRAKYDVIGKEYNTTRCADTFISEKLYQLLSPSNEGVYLDIGCGTGNYTHVLHQKGIKFIGVDPSFEMLRKANAQNPEIDWRQGHAENTGLEPESVSGIIGSLTIHHWLDLNTAFTELYRILKPKGRIVIFTSTPKQMKGYWLNHYFPKMLANSIEQMPSLESVFKAILEAGFKELAGTPYYVQRDLQDLFLYCGKYNPSLYLRPEVRQGISSFSSLANKEEVDAGLKKLKTDIATGKIEEVMASYKNDLGDYVFISAMKE
ncbi:class I SAM-dependent methyltransferase [Ascidiimonas sp. W6]|uniref:class I SAM-dependent methyltransferase n=1 Tax=Ascidiimonas meishanensis TaxID=3128903 RepID=UPI0030EB9B21